MRRRTLLIGLLAAPVVAASRPKSPKPRAAPTPTPTPTPPPTSTAPPPAAPPPGWDEVGTADDTTIGDTYLAAGDDRDLAAALGSVPADVTRAAVRVSGS